MTRLNLLTALAFLVLVLALLALHAWAWGPMFWNQLDVTLVVFTAMSTWLGFSVGLATNDEPEESEL